MNPAQVVDPVVDAARHPIRTTAWAVGLVRGLAAAVIRAASGDNGPAGADQWSSAVDAPEEDTAPEEVHRNEEATPPPVLEVVEPAPEREPEPLPEAFANEPKAVSRASEHGRGGNDAEIDDWYGEPVEPEDEGGGFVLEALAAGDDDPAVQTGDLKAILKESEILRKAADPDKG